jgi:hypothetical protein
VLRWEQHPGLEPEVPFAFRLTIIYNYAAAERKEEQHARARCCPLRFEVFTKPLVEMSSCTRRRTVVSSGRYHHFNSSAEERKCSMDARNVRIGETGLEQLIQWLRQTGKPQSLEALTERYMAILRELVQVEEVS